MDRAAARQVAVLFGALPAPGAGRCLLSPGQWRLACRRPPGARAWPLGHVVSGLVQDPRRRAGVLGMFGGKTDGRVGSGLRGAQRLGPPPASAAFLSHLLAPLPGRGPRLSPAPACGPPCPAHLVVGCSAVSVLPTPWTSPPTPPGLSPCLRQRLGLAHIILAADLGLPCPSGFSPWVPADATHLLPSVLSPPPLPARPPRSFWMVPCL